MIMFKFVSEKKSSKQKLTQELDTYRRHRHRSDINSRRASIDSGIGSQNRIDGDFLREFASDVAAIAVRGQDRTVVCPNDGHVVSVALPDCARNFHWSASKGIVVLHRPGNLCQKGGTKRFQHPFTKQAMYKVRSQLYLVALGAVFSLKRCTYMHFEKRVI